MATGHLHESSVRPSTWLRFSKECIAICAIFFRLVVQPQMHWRWYAKCDWCESRSGGKKLSGKWQKDRQIACNFLFFFDTLWLAAGIFFLTLVVALFVVILAIVNVYRRSRPTGSSHYLANNFKGSTQRHRMWQELFVLRKFKKMLRSSGIQL